MVNSGDAFERKVAAAQHSLRMNLSSRAAANKALELEPSEETRKLLAEM